MMDRRGERGRPEYVDGRVQRAAREHDRPGLVWPLVPREAVTGRRRAPVSAHDANRRIEGHDERRGATRWLPRERELRRTPECNRLAVRLGPPIATHPLPGHRRRRARRWVEAVQEEDRSWTLTAGAVLDPGQVPAEPSHHLVHEGVTGTGDAAVRKRVHPWACQELP